MDARIPYRVEKTKNKHSRAVYQAGTVLIRLAKNLSTKEEQAHVELLLRRMKKVLLRERKRHVIHPFEPLLQGESQLRIALSDGMNLLFTLEPAEKLRMKEIQDGWRITVAPRTTRRDLHRILWKALSKSALRSVSALVESINTETLRVQYTEVRLRFGTSQWGSCSSNGAITLNPALLLLPPELLRYVVIHELAHRTHQNHSIRFWSLVQSVLPNVDELRKALRSYRLPPL